MTIFNIYAPCSSTAWVYSGIYYGARRHPLGFKVFHWLNPSRTEGDTLHDLCFNGACVRRTPEEMNKVPQFRLRRSRTYEDRSAQFRLRLSTVPIVKLRLSKDLRGKTMFELSEAEIQVLEELWKLIQTERTLQESSSVEVGNDTVWRMSLPLKEPARWLAAILPQRWVGKN